jgi:signal transduction histidine kinase
MGRALLTSLLWLIIIGTLSGLFVARRVLHRVDAMNASARSIMVGNLEGRLPVNGSNDELDRLAENINAMIARISDLVSGMRNVSDNIAHDLKTPLTRMRSRAERTLHSAASKEDYRQSLEKVIEESDGLIRIFNALLMITRVETGADMEGLKVFNVGEIAKDFAEMYEPVADDAGFELTLDVEPNLRVEGSRELVGQAVANLLDNAIKYGMPLHPKMVTGESTKDTGEIANRPLQSETFKCDQHERPAISMSVRKRGANIEFQVSDNGPGIRDEDTERVLDRFVRLEGSRSKPGSGLGLSLAVAVARLHNGELRLENNNPGLRVILVLPAAVDPNPLTQSER